MYRISGPIAAYALKMGDKNIILFGDWHESNDKQCTPCKKDCIYIVDLLKQIKPNTDLFIESYIHSQLNRDVEPHDVISNVLKTFHHKMHNHNGTKQNNIRVHYSDIRTLDNYKAFYKTIMYLIAKINYEYTEKEVGHMNHFPLISWCDTQQKLKAFIDIMLTSDDYIQSVSSLIPHDVVRYFTYKYDLMIHQRKYISRLHKQLLVLTPEQQSHILKFHEDTCQRLIKKHNKYNDAMHHYNMYKFNTRQNEYYIANALFAWSSHIKDLYTIARMLQYIDKTNNIISYDGAAHSRIYANFFKKYMKAKVLHKENHYKRTLFSDTYKLTNGNETRCVQLPKSTVKDVFNVVLDK